MARLRKALSICVKRGHIPSELLERTEDFLAFDVHAVRHTIRSLLHARGHSEHALNEVLGQDAAETARRYTHVYEAAKVAIADDLGRLLNGRPASAKTGVKLA